jgi:hypothetical protein
VILLRQLLVLLWLLTAAPLVGQAQTATARQTFARFGASLELPAGTVVVQEARMLLELELGGSDCRLRLGRSDPVSSPRRLMQTHQRVYLGGGGAPASAKALEQLPGDWKALGGTFQPRVQGDWVAALFWTGSDGGWFGYLRCGGRGPKDPWLDPALGLVTLLKGLAEVPR